jgi:hypothetical protein
MLAGEEVIHFQQKSMQKQVKNGQISFTGFLGLPCPGNATRFPSLVSIHRLI